MSQRFASIASSAAKPSTSSRRTSGMHRNNGHNLHKINWSLNTRRFATPPVQENQNATISTAEYHAFSDETMEALLTSLESLVDEAANAAYEVEYSSGVLTLKLGENGTYVINKQPPNKQIWLSSPKSGPKRYDYDAEGGRWIYARDGQSLGKLLEEELSTAFDKEVRLGVEPE